MKRLRERFWIPFWIAPRGYYALTAVALLFAAGAVVPPFFRLALAASAALAALVALDAATAPRRTEIDVARIAPPPFSLRRSAAIAYAVRNRSERAVRVAIVEAPVRLLRFDRDVVAEQLAPRSEAQIERPVTPVARGTAELTAMFATCEGSIGLLRRRVRIRQTQRVRVYPDLSAVERYGKLHMRNRVIEAGLRRMRLRGMGTEPESVREWASGDPFRAINWKATARRGRVMVAQYEVERTQNVMIVLDAGRLMTPRVGEQRKFDYAVTAALSVASVAALANDKIGLVAFAGGILHAQAPRQSGRSSAALAAAIHGIEPRFEESDYESAFAYLRAKVHKRSLIVFFTDMVDPVSHAAVLAQIGTLARRHLVVCAFMNDAAIEDRLDAEPQSAGDAYETAVALELRDERRSAAAVLSRLGVQTIDVPARQLTNALIDRYLQIKQRGLL